MFTLIVGAIVAAIAGAGGRDALAAIIRFWRRKIQRRIDDPEAQARALAVMDEAELHAAELASLSMAGAEAIRAVHLRYESSLADYECAIDQLVAELFPAQVGLAHAGLALREALGDVEYLEILADVEADLSKARARRERQDARGTAD